MRVALIYNAVADESRPEESDVLIQVDAVAQLFEGLQSESCSRLRPLEQNRTGHRL